jgi:RNA-directed DNA polymerase
VERHGGRGAVTAKLTRDALTDWGGLSAAYREARRGKRHTRAVDAWFVDCDARLLALQQRLREGYRFGPYNTFRVNDPRPRLIAAAPFEDRVVHHAIVRVIGPLLEPRLVTRCVACRAGFGGTEAKRLLLEQCRSARSVWYAKCDVRRYFASIRHDLLRRQLRPLCGDAWAADLLDALLDSWHTEGCAGRGIPIGDLTSQLFANAYLMGVDQFMLRTARARGYIRYVDDMVWFADDRDTLRRQLDQLGVRLDSMGRALHPRKTRIGKVSEGVDFAGVVATARTVRVRGSTKRRALRHLTALRRGWRSGVVREARYLDRLRSVVALFRSVGAGRFLARRGLAW